MAKRQTPEQRFKQLFNMSNDESTTPQEREVAARKCHEWLKRNGRKPIDIPEILAEAVKHDQAASPSPPPSPSGPPPNPYGDSFNPATLVEEIAIRYASMRPHVRVVYTLWIVASHVYTAFRIAPRVLLVSDKPDSGKTTALEMARALMFRANEGAFATDAAIRDHLSLGPGSVALDEGDLFDPAARRSLLRLWNSGHVEGASHSMMVGGQRRVVSLFAPMIAAGLGRILGQAQLTRTFVLVMSPYGAGDRPEFQWWAPAQDGPDSIVARKEALGLLYQYLRHCAGAWALNPQPSIPAELERRAADNVRPLLAVAAACGGDWPRRAREALVTLINEMAAELPQVLIVRHGLMLFDQLETDWFEIGQFNKELHRLSAPEFDWNRYCGASGLDLDHRPISISEQGRLLAAAGIRSHPMWPRGVGYSQRQRGTCRRVYRRTDFEAASRRADASPPALRLVKPPA